MGLYVAMRTRDIQKRASKRAGRAGSPGTEDAGNYGLRDLSAEKQTGVLCKNPLLTPSQTASPSFYNFERVGGENARR